MFNRQPVPLGSATCPLGIENRKSGGFTLIELLVVIAIISLLISILLPSLNRANELAKRVLCLTHQRSIVTSQILYSQDYKGVIQIGFVGSWFNPPTANYVQNYYVKMNGSFQLHGVLHEQEFLPDPEMLYCPSTRPGQFAYDHHATDWNNNPWDSPSPRASLGPRPESPGTCDVWPPRIIHFANKAICGDVCGIYVYVYDTHTDGINVAYGDGSAHWMDGSLFMDALIEIVEDHLPGTGYRTDSRIYDIWTDVFDMEH